MPHSKKDTNDNAEQRIITAATQVFINKGFDGARMQFIADEAGINKALLHYYFRSKEQLFLCVFEKMTSNMYANMVTILESDKPFSMKIKEFVASEIDMLCARPNLPLFIIREIHRDAQHFQKMVEKSAMKNLFVLFHSVVEKAMESKEIVRVDSTQLLLNILSLIRFPFVARPMFTALSGLQEEQYNAMLQQRKTDLADFIIRSLQY